MNAIRFRPSSEALFHLFLGIAAAVIVQTNIFQFVWSSTHNVPATVGVMLFGLIEIIIASQMMVAFQVRKPFAMIIWSTLFVTLFAFLLVADLSFYAGEFTDRQKELAEQTPEAKAAKDAIADADRLMAANAQYASVDVGAWEAKRDAIQAQIDAKESIKCGKKMYKACENPKAEAIGKLRLQLEEPQTMIAGHEAYANAVDKREEAQAAYAKATSVMTNAVSETMIGSFGAAGFQWVAKFFDLDQMTVQTYFFGFIVLILGIWSVYGPSKYFSEYRKHERRYRRAMEKRIDGVREPMTVSIQNPQSSGVDLASQIQAMQDQIASLGKLREELMPLLAPPKMEPEPALEIANPKT
jgi:hypothetical protein